MTLAAGTYAELEIAREAPFGYFLTDGRTDVLLHHNERVGELAVGGKATVFVYHDSQDRLAATMREPLLQYGELGLLGVVDVHDRLGCFLDIGLSRHVLLPIDELPELEQLRPQKGDRVYAVLDRDKQGRLIARAAGERELAERAIRAPGSWKNEWVEAIVYNTLKQGTFVVCDGGVLGFGVIGLIHESERPQPLRVGQAVKARVTFVREDGRVNLSLRSMKREGRDEDADKLLAVLRDRPNGSMPYSDETPADIIMKRFGISKSAFKRAIGKLMKEGLVEQQGSWTSLLRPGGESPPDDAT